ncbi:MAG TPA: Kdo hydroxylase family protein [Gemmataceae bacterium]|nr:Kdo hydroxylase family protein [Gemmataceae bacterium]
MTAPPDAGLEERLERGEVVYYPVCPFPAPEGEDRAFLLAQELGSRAHKNISFDPHTGRASGFRRRSRSESARLRDLLAGFSATATAWLARALPRYTRHWRLDMVSYRPLEEATRRLRLKARNDLLHVDAFPSRPTNGWRILRLFVNVNPADPRIWVTSEPFARLFARYGAAAGLPGAAGESLVRQLSQGVLRLFHPRRVSRSAYDAFMLRFHDYLKAHDDFQEHGPKRFWSFAPGSAWLAMTDTCSHAVMRGRYALEHSYFISPDDLALPDESPAAILERACGRPVLDRAA